MKRANGKTKLKALWITLSIVFVLLIVAYGLTVYYFTSRFSFNTTINGVDCTFMTVDEVEEVIKKQVEGYIINITGRDNLSVYIEARDVSLRYEPDGQVKVLFEKQNPFLWFLPLFQDPLEATIKPDVRYDAARLPLKLDALGLYSKQRAKPPKDAFIEFVESEYVIRPEVLGSTLIPERTEKVTSDALLAMVTELDLDEKDCYLAPEVSSDDPELNETVNTWNTYARFAVFYTFGDRIEALDASITMDWIIIAEDGSGRINEQAVQSWVREFGKKYDTIGKTRKFVTILGEQKEVSGGDYGWEIDENAEYWAILHAYNNHTGITRPPFYVKTAAVHNSPGELDWGTTFIELDLANQHLYLHIDGKVVFEADVVSGAPWNNQMTPAGVWYIKQMLSPAKLVGEIQTDGKPEYEVWVSYWMMFTWMGHGFHDANWQPWFGGNRYTYAGSHGCVNMYYYDAQEMYSLVYLGFPVVAYW